MLIRPLEEKDIPQILAIYNPYIEKTCVTLEEKTLSLEEFAKRTRGIAASFPYLVAEENGEILGYVYLDKFHERSAYSISVDLSIYLKMGLTHHGLGTQLWEAVLSLAKEKRYENVISLVTNENPVSMAWHAKMGFLLEGRLHHVARKMGKDIDTLFYRYPIR